MTALLQQTFNKLSQLPEHQQDKLATYLEAHQDEILKQAEKEERIANGSYTIDDFNEKTQAAIREVEEERGKLKRYKSAESMFKDLEI